MNTSPLILALAVQISSGLGDLDPEVAFSDPAYPSGVVEATEYNGSARELVVPARKSGGPDIAIDGRLDESAWARC